MSAAVLQGVSPFEVGGRWLSYFARASTGTYIDEAGGMQVADVDVPRVDWSTGTAELLLEDASTNVFENSTTGWSGAGSGFTQALSSAVPRLDLGSAVFEATATALNVDTNAIDFAYSAPLQSTSIASSCWVWIPSSFAGSFVGWRGDALSNFSAKLADLSKRDQWQLVTGVGAGTFSIAVLGVIAGAVGDVVYVTCPQVEFATAPSSYIRTAGAPASRAADVALFVPPPPLGAPPRNFNTRTADEALLDLLALSPPGDGMPSSRDTTWAQMLRPMAAAISDTEQSMGQFSTEIDPGTALYLLPDYERVLGPDPFGRDPGTMTVAQRQQLALSRWVQKYGVRPADFEQMAADLGVTITIREFFPGQCGRMQCGAGPGCVSAPTQFTWLVTLPKAPLQTGQCGVMQCGSPTSFFEVSLVQGVIAQRAPAHTTVLFSYTG